MSAEKFMIIICLISNSVFGQINYCGDFKTGVFQFLGNDGGVYTIIRTDTNQYERNSKRAQHSYMKIKWLSDCQYILYDRTAYKWGEAPQKDTIIKEVFNKVYKFEKPNTYYVKTFVSGFSDTIKTVLMKLDTTKYYTNLFQQEKFSEYKNSRSYSQTLLGEIHSIAYYESNKTENKSSYFRVRFPFRVRAIMHVCKSLREAFSMKIVGAESPDYRTHGAIFYETKRAE